MSCNAIYTRYFSDFRNSHSGSVIIHIGGGYTFQDETFDEKDIGHVCWVLFDKGFIQHVYELIWADK
jgi:uncharacterized Fe-S cluster-containing protein